MDFIKKYWPVFCGILALAITLFFFYDRVVRFSVDPLKDATMTTFRSLIVAFIGFFITNSMRKRLKRTKIEFLFMCFATFFSLCAINKGLNVKKIYQVNNAQQEFARLARHEFSTQCNATNDYDTEEFGDFAYPLSMWRHSLEFSQKMKSEIQVACTHFQSIFTPQYLAEYQNVMQAKERLRNLLDVLNQYEKKVPNELAFLESKFNKLFSEKSSAVKVARTEFEKEKRISTELLSEYFQIEHECVHVFNEMLNLLAANSGAYYWNSDNTLRFESDADVAMWNKLVEKSDDIIKRESLVMQKLKERNQLAKEQLEKCSRMCCLSPS